MAKHAQGSRVGLEGLERGHIQAEFRLENSLEALCRNNAYQVHLVAISGTSVVWSR